MEPSLTLVKPEELPTETSTNENIPGTSSSSGRQTRSTRSNFKTEGSNRDNFTCPVCGFVGDSRATKAYHLRQEHPGYDPNVKIERVTPEPNESPPKKQRKNRSKKVEVETEEDVKPDIKMIEIVPRCLTTKELIGGSNRKRREHPPLPPLPPKPPQPSSSRSQQPQPSSSSASEHQDLQSLLHSNLSVPSSDMSVADFLKNQTLDVIIGNSIKNNQEMMPESSENLHHQNSHIVQSEIMDIGGEVEIFDENDPVEEQRRRVAEQVNSYRVNIHAIGENAKKNTGRMGAPRKKNSSRPKVYDPQNIPLRLRVGDRNGKYQCYIQDCEWRGTYRSLRMEHMRAIHPDWKMPSRYLLQRISKDGVYIDPEKYVPPFACTVEGCGWRGNYRASRSSHMRQCHNDVYLENKKRMAMGSYHSDGNYLCHLAECDWRGASRSTRAAHMKKEHPGWKNESLRKTFLLECFACGSTMPSHQLLIEHIDEYHGLGLHVDMTFDTRTEYLIWLATVERFYQIEFMRRMCHRQPINTVKYNLICACGAHKNEMVMNARAAVYMSSFLKRRNERVVTRRKIDCCLFLEVKEEINPEGKVTVTGCLEHTGHRFGTPLLRFNVLERQAFHDFMNFRNEQKMQMPMLKVLDMLVDIEGFTIDNFFPSTTSKEFQHFDNDPILSLRKLIELQELKSSMFASNILPMNENEDSKKNGNVSFGYMTEEMKKLYRNFGAERVVIIDQVALELAELSMTLFFVIILDSVMLPKCCCVYLTTDNVQGFDAVIRQLFNVDDRPPRTILADPSHSWVEIIGKYWPNGDIEVQISEWTLLDHWATVIEKLIRNDLDQFCLMTSLRRLLRINDVQQFVFFIIELFEAIFEIGQEDFFKFFDFQLSDQEYFKRWSPMHRNEMTSHSNPTLSIACRYFRERFLNPSGIETIDVYFAHMLKMINEFNICCGSETYTLRPLDPMRTVYYPSVVIDGMAPRMEQQQEVYVDNGIVYDVVDARDVEVEIEEMYETGNGHVVQVEEIIGEEVGEEVIIETEETNGDEMLVAQHEQEEEEEGEEVIIETEEAQEDNVILMNEPHEEIEIETKPQLEHLIVDEDQIKVENIIEHPATINENDEGGDRNRKKNSFMEEIIEQEEMIDVGNNEEVIMDQTRQDEEVEEEENDDDDDEDDDEEDEDEDEVEDEDEDDEDDDDGEEEDEEEEELNHQQHSTTHILSKSIRGKKVTIERAHETTKEVIGTRKLRSRFRLPPGIELHHLDKKTIQEIASRVIESDGRKGPRMTKKIIPSKYRRGYSNSSTRLEVSDTNQPSTSTKNAPSQPSTSSEKANWRNF